MKKISLATLFLFATHGYAGEAFRDHGYSCKENYNVNTQIKGKVKTPIKSITGDYLCEPLFSDDASLSAALGFAAGSPNLDECRAKMKEKLDKITNTDQLRDALKGMPDNAKRSAMGILLVGAPDEVLNSDPKAPNENRKEAQQTKKEDKNFEKNKRKLLDYLFSNKTVEIDMNQSDASKSTLDTKSDGSNIGLMDFAESYDLEQIKDEKSREVMKSNADFLGTSKKEIRIDGAKYMSREGKNKAFVTKATADMFASIPGVKVSALRFSTLNDFHPSTTPDGLEKIAKKTPVWPQYLVALDTSDPNDPTVLFVKAEWKRTFFGKWKLEATQTQRAPLGKETSFKFSDSALNGTATSSGDITVSCQKESTGSGNSGSGGDNSKKSDQTSSGN